MVRMSVFGSKVRGDYREKSDIDILVIVKERSLRVMDQIAEITSDLNIEFDLSITPVVFSEHEYDMNATMASPFSLAVHEEKLNAAGDLLEKRHCKDSVSRSYYAIFTYEGI